jgi:hypothetical protein
MVVAIALRTLQQSPLQAFFDVIGASHLQPRLATVISNDQGMEFDFLARCKHRNLHTCSFVPLVPC